MPSPTQPSRQRHLKLPGRLTQAACMSQLWDPISHSSTSGNIHIKQQLQIKSKKKQAALIMLALVFSGEILLFLRKGQLWPGLHILFLNLRSGTTVCMNELCHLRESRQRRRPLSSASDVPVQPVDPFLTKYPIWQWQMKEPLVFSQSPWRQMFGFRSHSFTSEMDRWRLYMNVLTVEITVTQNESDSGSPTDAGQPQTAHLYL